MVSFSWWLSSWLTDGHLLSVFYMVEKKSKPSGVFSYKDTRAKSFFMNVFEFLGFPAGSNGNESVWKAGDFGSILGSGWSPGEGNGYLLQYSCLENPMDRGPWWATVHGVTKTWMQLSDLHTLTNHEGPETLQTLSNVNCLPNILFPNTISLGVRASTYEFRVNTNIQPIISTNIGVFFKTHF